ncbi:YhgE/Pip family protein [Agromyces atrinae]|uniref:YhgE/Pip family protein n=1 Tax=Agromyces atrinae TaxID=592376 RepID=UPI001F586981|nr:YhgE/Pip family protein [Agromyces atrinae]MCI2956461.1 YhgE/Pip family protein [Agromyces atrinae]
MKTPQMIATELRRLTATTMSRIALIALIAVPVLYGGLYLWANQDPYARLNQVPVAIVNLDTGSGTGDSARNVADEVVANLVDAGTFDWHVVSEADGTAGVDDGTYDFSLTFPADFSESLASAQGSDPRQGEVILTTNDANSYLATTIGEQAVKTVQAEITRTVGREAATKLLDGLSTIRGSLVEAGDGASTLTDAVGQAGSGAGELHAGAGTLADGAAQLADGTRQVADGARQVADGNAELAASADRVAAATNEAAAAVPQVRADILTRLEQSGLDPATITDIMTRLDDLGSDVTAGNDRVQEVVGRIDQLSAGANTLAEGAASAADGAAAAAGGSATLRDGLGTLVSGLGTIDEGAAQLRDGLVDGAASIPDTDATTRAKQAETIADPIRLETSQVTAAGTYGAGLAPFFAALAAWIGIYALFLIVKPVSRRAVTALHSPIRITLAGWLTPALLGAIQMVGLFLVLALALGFSMTHPAGVIGIMLLGSATFAAIILALNVWLGSVGQFLGLVLMVVQLVTAGGTFPWQTLPAPLAALHHVLPMSFVVDAMRRFMYGGELGGAWTDILVLLAILLGAFAVAAIGVTRMTHYRTLRDLQPSLIG